MVKKAKTKKRRESEVEKQIIEVVVDERERTMTFYKEGSDTIIFVRSIPQTAFQRQMMEGGLENFMNKNNMIMKKREAKKVENKETPKVTAAPPLRKRGRPRKAHSGMNASLDVKDIAATSSRKTDGQLKHGKADDLQQMAPVSTTPAVKKRGRPRKVITASPQQFVTLHVPQRNAAKKAEQNIAKLSVEEQHDFED